MRARVLSFNLGHVQALEENLNEFLEQAGTIRIDNVTNLPGDGPLGALVVFYSETGKSRPAQVCAQCRKNPPVKGLKVCEGCREYQKDYRQKRKTENKTRYP